MQYSAVVFAVALVSLSCGLSLRRPPSCTFCCNEPGLLSISADCAHCVEECVESTAVSSEQQSTVDSQEQSIGDSQSPSCTVCEAPCIESRFTEDPFAPGCGLCVCPPHPPILPVNAPCPPATPCPAECPIGLDSHGCQLCGCPDQAAELLTIPEYKHSSIIMKKPDLKLEEQHLRA